MGMSREGSLALKLSLEIKVTQNFKEITRTVKKECKTHGRNLEENLTSIHYKKSLH